MIDIVQFSFVSIIPLLVVALGGLMSEKSGVTNIALEGLMLIGAFIGIWAIQIMQNGNMPSHLIYLLGILIGGIVGAIIASLHAYAAISMSADQTISATAINLFAPAFAIFTARSIIGGQQVRFNPNFRIDKIPILGDIPIIGDIFFSGTYISFYLAILLIVAVYILLFKTKLGLRIRAVGENPQAAASLGISVVKIRYFTVITSGFLAGMGGVIFVATTSAAFDATVAGMGFLAIAVLIFGNWRPFRILLAAIFFGFFRTIANASTLIPWLNDLNIPQEFLQMIPYLATLIALALTSRRTKAPAALGQVYDQAKR